MLKSIAQGAPELTQFAETLNLSLSEPQRRHVRQIADALITIDGDKNLSNLYRHIVGNPCPKSAADTFRKHPGKPTIFVCHFAHIWSRRLLSWPRSRRLLKSFS